MLRIAVCLAFLLADPKPPIEPLPVPEDWPVPVKEFCNAYAEQAASEAEAPIVAAWLKQQSDLVAGMKTWRPANSEERRVKPLRQKWHAQKLELMRAGIVFPDFYLDTVKPRTGRLGFWPREIRRDPKAPTELKMLPMQFEVQHTLDGSVFGSLDNHRTCVLLGLDSLKLAEGEVITHPGIWECLGTMPYPGGQTLYTYRLRYSIQLKEWQDLRIADYWKAKGIKPAENPDAKPEPKKK